MNDSGRGRGGGEHKQTRDHPRTTLRLRKSFTKLQKHIEDYYGNVALAIIKEFFFVTFYVGIRDKNKILIIA